MSKLLTKKNCAINIKSVGVFTIPPCKSDLLANS